MKKIKVFIVDDHAILRKGLISLVNQEADLEAVGEASDGECAIAQVRKTSPDVVIMDLAMPGMDGAEATGRLRESAPSTKVLILTTFGTSDRISHALEMGASGAIMKSADFTDLVNAIRTVFRGGRYIAPDIQDILDSDPPVPALSSRQKDILQMLVEGLMNKEIAERLHITLPVVKEHVNLLFAKIGATNRTEAVAIALRKHLLGLENAK